jgi:hypothetical protein
MEPGYESEKLPETIPIGEWEAFTNEWRLSVAGGEVRNKPIDTAYKSLAANVFYKYEDVVGAYVPVGAVYKRVEDYFHVGKFTRSYESHRLDIELPDKVQKNEKWPFVYWLEGKGYEVEKICDSLYVQRQQPRMGKEECRYFAIYSLVGGVYVKDTEKPEGIYCDGRVEERLLTISEKERTSHRDDNMALNF